MNDYENQHKYIYTILKSIEENLVEDNKSKYICEEINYVSKMQLHRDFYSVTGYTVNEYIRKRRLSNALAKIKASIFPLVDIALNCGYSSQQSLCREIKNTIGITATEYRKSEEYFYFPPFNYNTHYQISVSKLMIPKTTCLRYYDSNINGIENRALYKFLSGNPNYKGRIFGRNGKQESKKLCYELYIENISDLKIDCSGFIQGELFGATHTSYATISISNNIDDINTAWDYLYFKWLPRSMFEYAGLDNKDNQNKYFEEFLYNGNRAYRIKLYLPLIKKQDYPSITIENMQEKKQFLVCAAKGVNAENVASKKVIAYLSEYYPDIIFNAKEFFIRRGDNTCTSGVLINDSVEVKDNTGLRLITLATGDHVILHSSNIGDYESYKHILLSWINENVSTNGKREIKDVYALYNTSDSYKYPEMKLFAPISNKNKPVII